MTVVGAGPGDPELLTLRAVRAMQAADVILFDEQVSAEVLDFARREAKKILVGKIGGGPSCEQHDSNGLMVALARQGRHVVRLMGGDPLVVAGAAEEIAARRAADVSVVTVPGIGAAQDAAACFAGTLPDATDGRSLADSAFATASAGLLHRRARTAGHR